jgi:DNA polymerase-3 subunit alpha
MNNSTEFVHLHTHSIFSTLDGVCTPSEYIEACAERKWPALAITEHGHMSSIPDAYLAAKKYGIKYIAGCEVYYSDYDGVRCKIAESGIKLNDIKKHEDIYSRTRRNRHLTVLCKNMEGYRNLLRINKIAYEKYMWYGRPRVNLGIFNDPELRRGLIVLSGCLNGPICHEIRNNNYDTNVVHESSECGRIRIINAESYVRFFRKLFGDDFYIEMQMPGVEGDLEVFEKLACVAEEYHIKPVVSCDSHYLHRKDYEIQKIMMAIDQNVHWKSDDLFHVNSDEQFFKTREQLRETFLGGYSKNVSSRFFEQACDNTMEVADKCESFDPDLKPKLPKIDNADSLIVEYCYKSLKDKGLFFDDKKYLVDGVMVTHREQTDIEIQRLVEKGFSSYFLITKDIVEYSVRLGKPVGPRGSAGGSLVCYLLGISTINPLKFGGLSFDRFMSPARGGTMLQVTMD